MSNLESAASPQATILIVDDRRPNLLALEATLAPLNARIVTAMSGEEALRHVFSEQFALIILDLLMPGLDGLETAALIKSRERSRSIPIIFLSAAEVDHGLRIKAYELGAADWIQKPYDGFELRAKARVFVDLYQQSHEAQRRAEAELLGRITSHEENQRRADDRIRYEFLATVAHELRDPLNAVRGWTQVLQSGPLTPEQTRHALEVIDRNTALQTRLVEDLLDISRLSTGNLAIKRQRVNLSSLVEVVLDAHSPTAGARGIELRPSLDGHLTEIEVDPVRIQQVVRNLVTNAIKFSPDGGTIDVSIGTSDGGVTITVEDRGIGISADFLPFVFERYRQLDPFSVENRGGLGLGLWVVRQLVELHGGRIHAASAGLGQGSTFTVFLPAPRRVEG
jgi:signal transduction histidine kinase